jgi:hypothetical protein
VGIVWPRGRRDSLDGIDFDIADDHPALFQSVVKIAEGPLFER